MLAYTVRLRGLNTTGRSRSSDPTRRAIFERLTRNGEQTVHAFTERAGVSQPMVSKHLSALKRARLVRHRRKGRETHDSAQPQALAPLADWMECL